MLRGHGSGITSVLKRVRKRRPPPLPVAAQAQWFEEKRFPAVAVREFIASREQVWNAWEPEHATLDAKVFQIFKTWFNEKTTDDLDYLDRVHRARP